jgi:hypothetical protein
MANITKQSIVDIYNTFIRDVRTADIAVASDFNQPIATRINQAELGPKAYKENMSTDDLTTTIIDAAEIRDAFKTYARYTTVVRNIRHGYITDNFDPNTAEVTTGDTNTVARLKDSYIVNATVPDELDDDTILDPRSNIVADLSDLQGYASVIEGYADNSLDVARLDLRVCHSSCHSSCHGSRGRR